MEVRPGYKQTDVGVIPEDWEVKVIAQVAPLQRGFDLPTREIRPGVFPVVCSNGVEHFHETAMVKGPGVVTGRSGTIGRVHFVETDFWPHNTSLWVTRFNGNSAKFIYYLYDSLGFERFASGSGVPTLNRNDAHSFRLALPSIHDEQRAIAAALGDVDALLAGLDRLIAKKRDLQQAAMQQLLTGQTRLPGFQGQWKVKRLVDVATFLKGKGLPKSSLSPSGAKPCIHYGELFTRYPAIIATVQSRTHDTAGAFVSAADDVLMPTSDVTPRGLAKASCIRFGGVILGGDILVIRPDSTLIFGPFLSYLIRNEDRQVLQLVTGTTVFHIYGRDMAKFKLGVPSVNEQRAIATVLSDMDAELTALAARRDKTHALKQGMMQELLTGRTRLPDAEGEAS